MTEQTNALQVAEYNPVEAAMAELQSRYAGVIFPVETKDGMKDAKEVRQKLVKLRTGLESLRKEIKEPALRRTQAIDVEAKSIEKQIRAIEEPIAMQIKIEEDRAEAEKEAKEVIERARIAVIKDKIAGIRNLPLALAGEPSDVIEAELQALAEFEPSEAAFAEFTADCATARHEVMGALRELSDRVYLQELAAARAIEEKRIADEALASERAAIQEEREAMARERAELADARAKIADERAKAELLERDRIAEEPSKQPAIASGEPEFTLHDKFEEEQATSPVSIAQAAIEFIAPEPATDGKIRQFTLATADQFAAMAGKVAICGAASFAAQLFEAAKTVREGHFDAAFAGADSTTLVQFDNDLIDATVNAIDALGGVDVQAAA